jgi:glycosyltransferase involved in cell wall biosynthesis
MADANLVFNGRTPDLHPLGGSQSSLVYLARALVELGHKVTVYNKTLGTPMAYDGVEYKWFGELQNLEQSHSVDAFIANRDIRILPHYKGSGVRIMRMQDDGDQPILQNFALVRLRMQIDHLFCVSEWQKKRLCRTLRWPLDRATVHPNGFWEPHFTTLFPEPVGNRLAYASTPARGLYQLLDIFPHIRKQVPDAELHVFSDMKLYQLHEDDEAEYDYIYAKLDQPGVVHRGSVGNKELAKGLSECKILSYSNTFQETSCIAAMEAQAAGCVVVTSAIGALPETVGPHGFFIPGYPGNEEYNTKFIDKCVALLKYEEGWRSIAIKAKAWIARNDMRKLAPAWIEQIDQLRSGRKSKCLI